MNEDPVVQDVASSGSLRACLGAQPGPGKARGVGGLGVERGMEPAGAGRLENSTSEQLTAIPVSELQRLYATINCMRERLKELGEDSILGCADKVILDAMGQPMTRSQLATATKMTRAYLHVRLYRLAAMGCIEKAGKVSRVGIGKGQGETLWKRSIQPLQ